MADYAITEIVSLPENFVINPDADYFVIQKVLDSTTYKLKFEDIATKIQELNDAPHDGGYYFRRNGQWTKEIDYGGY